MKAGKITYPGVGVAVGGLVGFVGIIMHWFAYSYTVNGETLTVTLSGTADFTGSIALAASFGAFAFGGAYILFDDIVMRRLFGVLMSVSAAFLLIMPLFAFTRIDEAVGSPAAQFTVQAAAGLVISFMGGVLAVVASFLSSRDFLTASASEPVESPTGSEVVEV
jgi:hypothetical protein